MEIPATRRQKNMGM